MTATRHIWVVGGFIAAMFVLSVRLAQLTILDNGFLIEQGIKRAERTQPIPTTRGNIVDRNGEPLAISTPVPSIWIDPSTTNLTSEQIAAVADVLGMKADKLERRIVASGTKRFMYLKRRVHPRVASELFQLNLADIRIDTEYNRFYPFGEITAHVVGITDPDENGLEGLELVSNRRLRGTPGSKRILQDAKGSSIKEHRKHESSAVW